MYKKVEVDKRKCSNRKRWIFKADDSHPEYLKIIDLISSGEAKPSFYDENVIALKDGRLFTRYRNRFLAQRKNREGYLGVSIKKSGVMKTENVHRIIAKTFIGDYKRGMVVNHKNGIKHDNRIENLEIVTYSQNSIHGIYELRAKELKITPEVILDLEKMIIKGYIGREKTVAYAKKLGVSSTHINVVINKVRIDLYKKLFGESHDS